MKKTATALIMALSVFSADLNGQEYTGPFSHSLLDEHQYDLIVGESSGDRAYYHILDIAPYERDRKSEEYEGLFMESSYVTSRLKEYGLEEVGCDMRAPASLAEDGGQIPVIGKLRCPRRYFPEGRAHAVPCPGLSKELDANLFKAVFLEP